ncbi:MAG: HemK2/MTQ2 family protein methyltransferase [Promethearchaeota archaeon]
MSPAAAFFEDIWVMVNDGVYEPAEDTFMLCANLDTTSADTVLELGTGCGLVAIVAARTGARVIATDQSSLAIQNAKSNVALYNLQNQIEIRQGSFFDPIKPGEQFSLIAFNPPYLPGTTNDPAFDPTWSGGKEGREVTEIFLSQCSKYLLPTGRLLLIQSTLSNPEKTQKYLERHFHTVQIKVEKSFFFERLLLFEAIKPISTSSSKKL